MTRNIETLYPVKVDFTRHIFKGALAGLSLPQTLGFPDRRSAKLWIKDIKLVKFNGYTYSDFSIRDTRTQEAK